MGSNFTGSKIASDNNMGLYYMAALDVFNSLEEPQHNHLSVGVSLFEIYGGKLFDLLNDRKAVKCLEDHKGKVNFPGLSEHKIESPGELIELIELGAMSRSTGKLLLVVLFCIPIAMSAHKTVHSRNNVKER